MTLARPKEAASMLLGAEVKARKNATKEMMNIVIMEIFTATDFFQAVFVGEKSGKK